MAMFNRYTLRGLRNALCAGAGLGVLGSAAIAQGPVAEPPLRLQTDYFGYAASVSGRFTYSDNINLAPDPLSIEEYFFSTAVSGGAITSTNRFTGIVLGDLDFSYLADSSDFNISQNVGATGTATVADNWLYVDVSGQTSRQLIGDNARFSRNINAARGQQANVHSFAASPYIYHRMPDQSSVALRYRYSQVFIDDSDSIFAVLNRNFLNDSRSHEVIATYDSGNLLDRARFNLSAYGVDTTEDGSGFLPEFGYRQGAVEASGQVALSRAFSLSGAVGYDEVETDDAAALFFDDEELSGVFWRAGFTASPNRRLNARIEYGERYGDDFVDADISYRVTERLTFAAGANRRFVTRAQNSSNRFREVQAQTLLYADQLRRGDEGSPRAVIDAANQYASILNGTNAQTIGVGVVDQAYAALSTNYERTSFTLSGNYSDSDFGFRMIEAFDINANLRRRLSRRILAYGNVVYRFADTVVDTATCEANPLVFGINTLDPLFDVVEGCAALANQNGATNTIIGSIGGEYQIYENVAAFAEYSYTERFSDVDFLEYSENTAFIGVRLDF
ncbi:MAG: hypothetical protein AAFW81_09235 [Pseudomonadota bacterium]